MSLLTREEIEVAAKRAETYPAGLDTGSWGTGPLEWASIEDEGEGYVEQHPGLWKFG